MPDKQFKCAKCGKIRRPIWSLSGEPYCPTCATNLNVKSANPKQPPTPAKGLFEKKPAPSRHIAPPWPQPIAAAPAVQPLVNDTVSAWIADDSTDPSSCRADALGMEAFTLLQHDSVPDTSVSPRRSSRARILGLFVIVIAFLGSTAATGRLIHWGTASDANRAIVKPAAPPAVIDLINLLDPDRDGLSGKWILDGGELTCDGSPRAKIRIPYRPPEEYDFRVEFTRLEGSEAITVMLMHHHPVMWIMDGWHGAASGFQLIAGKSAADNLSTAKGPFLKNQVRHSTVMRVRKGSIEAWLDGSVISRVQTDGSNLSIPRDWDLLGEGLGVGSLGGATVFHAIELEEVSGPGNALLK